MGSPTASDSIAATSTQTFEAARRLVENLQVLAESVQHYRPESARAGASVGWAITFAEAFVAWVDLTYSLTPEIVRCARWVHRRERRVIRLNEASEPAGSVLEAVDRGLGAYLVDVLYGDGECPFVRSEDQVFLDGVEKHGQERPGTPLHLDDVLEFPTRESRDAVQRRLNLKTRSEEVVFVAKEWLAMDAARSVHALARLRAQPCDYTELGIRLSREGDMVMAAVKRGRGSPDQPGPFRVPELGQERGRAAGDPDDRHLDVRDAPEVPERWLPASWYAQATAEFLYPGLLLNALKGKRIKGRKQGGRHHYELESVKQTFPAMAVALDAALAKAAREATEGPTQRKHTKAHESTRTHIKPNKAEDPRAEGER
jgi:hypothetical protein